MVEPLLLLLVLLLLPLVLLVLTLLEYPISRWEGCNLAGGLDATVVMVVVAGRQ